MQDGREERAQLAHTRQELLASVSAIAGYADILRDEARRFGLECVSAPKWDPLIGAKITFVV